ncbi:TIGR02594 family protein, partial [Neisseria gonorrhoeae]
LGKAGRAVIRDWYRAKAWSMSGLTKLEAPAYGCIAVKPRRGGGHVFFVVGKDAEGRILGLGGNQGNMVSIIPFDPADIDGYFWPSKLIGGKPVPSSPAEGRYRLTAATGAQGAGEA